MLMWCRARDIGYIRAANPKKGMWLRIDLMRAGVVLMWFRMEAGIQ